MKHHLGSDHSGDLAVVVIFLFVFEAEKTEFAKVRLNLSWPSILGLGWASVKSTTCHSGSH